MSNNVKCEYQFMRPQKAEWTKTWYDSLSFCDNLGYQEYNQAVVFPLKRFQEDNLLFGRGGVSDCDGNYITNSAIKDRVEENYPVDTIQEKNETAVYCGYLVKHWGHFLIEAVNRLWFFLKQDKAEYHYIFIVNDGEEREIVENYKEFFELLGIFERIELVNCATRYDKVIIPDISFNYLKFYSDEYRMIFERVIENALSTIKTEKNQRRKVFLSRSSFPKACTSEFGLDLLDNFFEKNGFEIIFPEQLSLTKMIVLMNNAEIVATESGSMSHNMLFCDYGKEFIIIERQTIVNRVQTSIDCVKKPKVTYVDVDMMIYPVIMGDGPFLMLYNKWFDAFARENNYESPDSQYMSEDYIKDNLKKYLSAYKNRYYMGVGFEGNQVTFMSLLLEGYYDSMGILGKYLNGQEPFCREQLKEERFSSPSLLKRIWMSVKRKYQSIWSTVQNS